MQKTLHRTLAMHPRSRASARAESGFLLNELLISLAVFAVGMSALASLFPVAAILQRETANEVLAGATAQAARAIVDSRRLTFGAPSDGDLGGHHAEAAKVGDTKKAVVSMHAISPSLLTQKFNQFARSYPTSFQVDSNNNGVKNDLTNCEMFWVPFIQDLGGDDSGTNQNWAVRVFVLARDSRVTYNDATVPGGLTVANPNDPNEFPKVVAIGCTVNGNTFSVSNMPSSSNYSIQAGDIVMDSNGVDHVVTNVSGSSVEVLKQIPTSPESPTQLWYAPRFDGPTSPAQRVVTISVKVLAP